VALSATKSKAASSLRSPRLSIAYVATSKLKLNPKNPRLHSERQIQQIARSVEIFGFNGNPPESTRFKKGQSGNPKGRRKGSHNVATVLALTLREKVVVNENGARKTVTKLEAAIKQLVNKAASGDLRALQQFIALAREAEPQRIYPRPRDRPSSSIKESCKEF
jgi:hypothetical protein